MFYFIFVIEHAMQDVCVPWNEIEANFGSAPICFLLFGTNFSFLFFVLVLPKS